ncbi:hypothetical protein HID58_057071 [Brassica napus]|uniref:C2 domain-containing protein n=1 Tax=Brassica napus TaxID=3708 RepID=A0ABQ8AQ37_BRANA|nr:hypothetical protein HID58_057071 [Brassica napus]
MGTHRLVSELSLDKPLLPVRVKVICKGPTVAGSGFQKTVLIIGDEKIDPIKHSSFYCFRNWDDLYRGLHHPKFPIDIYGQVIGVGFLEEYMMEPTNGNNGIIDHKIHFFVLHILNVVIKCVAYGALAHVFNDLWNSIDADINAHANNTLLSQGLGCKGDKVEQARQRELC